MTASPAPDENKIEGLRISKDDLRAFLKRHDAFKYWRVIGIVPKANGARPGSSLAGQRMLNSLVDDMCQRPIPTSALQAYTALWATIADKTCDNAWSKPTALDFEEQSVATTLIERILERNLPVAREDVLELINAGPFNMSELPDSIDKLWTREQLEAKRGVDEMRTIMRRLEDRVAELTGSSASLGELDVVKHELAETRQVLDQKITREIEALRQALNKDAGERTQFQGALQTELAKVSSLISEVSPNPEAIQKRLETIENEIASQKELSDKLADEIAALPVSSGNGPTSEPRTAVATRTEQAHSVPIKPIIKIIDRRDDVAVKNGLEEQLACVATVLRNAGIAKQSAEQSAAVITAAFVSSGWLNVTGSLSTYLAERLCAAVPARIAKVTIPVGCLEPIAASPREWSGTPTLWHVSGYDRAPAQVTSRHLRASVVKKLVNRNSESFVIAVH
jgi:hypothetical protein